MDLKDPGQVKLGRIGIWSMELRFGEAAAITDAAAELDELAYGALWIPGAMGGDLLVDIDRLFNCNSLGNHRRRDPQHLET